MCDVCDDESNSYDVGAACVPGHPLTIMWCRECLDRFAVPAWILEYELANLCDYNLAGISPIGRRRSTWYHHRYMTADEYFRIVLMYRLLGVLTVRIVIGAMRPYED
jgi:hypothetical protein